MIRNNPNSQYYPMPMKLGPEYETEWGTFMSPYVVEDPASRRERQWPVPSQYQGTRLRQQPRPLGQGAQYLGEHPQDEKWQLLVLIGVVGLLAWWLGKDAGAKRNPGATKRFKCPRCSAAKSRRMRRVALARPRDESGKFLPTGR